MADSGIITGVAILQCTNSYCTAKLERRACFDAKAQVQRSGSPRRQGADGSSGTCPALPQPI
jgi:hypothetical protein